MTGFEKYTEEMEAFRQSKLYNSKYTHLVSYLMDFCCGKENTKLDCEICKVVELKSVQLRALVKYARRRRVPIASCGDGYYYAKDSAELQTTISHLTERRDSLGFTIEQLQRADFGLV
jgi:hypothetical protein